MNPSTPLPPAPPAPPPTDRALSPPGMPRVGMARVGPHALLGILLGVSVGGCGGEAPTPEGVDPQAAFLQNLASPCGQAFPGRLVLEPEGDPMLTGSEVLVAHFRDCEPGEVRIPFHIEIEASGAWDRSRTWYVMVVAEGLELRHDHREPDGSESGRTWYGGFSVGEGTANRQDFHSPERTERAGVPVGWRMEMEPGSHYRYGTTYDGDFDWMIEFDLSTPMEGPIPDAWGHERPPSRIPGPP
jgi:hypothetical protein